MASSKKSFVLYFDACDSVRTLPAEQRGLLFTALCDYAQGLLRVDRPPEAALDELPELHPDARMAFLFMAGAIRRDTVKWQEKRQHCRAQALARFRGADTPGPGDAT